MDGLNSMSVPFGVAGLPKSPEIPISLAGSGRLSTGLPVEYDPSPPLYPPELEQRTSVDGYVEWMAMLEGIPVHNPVGNISGAQIANEKYLCIPPHEPFPDFVVENPSLPPPCIKDPLFTQRVEDTPLAPIFMSPVQNDPDLGDFIATLGGSLDSFSTETPESRQNSYLLSGTLLHSCEDSVF